MGRMCVYVFLVYHSKLPPIYQFYLPPIINLTDQLSIFTMKDLKILERIKATLGQKDIIGHCIDGDNKKLFVITEDLSVFDLGNDIVQRIEHNFSPNAINEKLRYDQVLLTEYIVETGCILIALSCGMIIKLAVSSFGQQSGRVYQHPVRICSVKISPSQDLVALADDDNKLFILTPDLDECMHKDDALNQNESLHKPVGVGWGSKETQFFGLDGRPSKEKEAKNRIILSEDELERVNAIEACDLFVKFKRDHERSTIIDWRGDGQLLASLTYVAEADKHYLKVWNRNLELQYMSEQLVTIERGSLCWIPNGQYVCCVQRRDKVINEIAMFEKNGMVHQRVTLPTLLRDLYINELAWSSNSSILAIVGVQFEVEPTGQVHKRHLLLLYTMQNFHYYLKYSTYLNNISSQDPDETYSIRWNPTNPSTLYVWSSRGLCLEFNCAFVTNYSLSNSLVSVQDANQLLLTPFDLCNIPPPMSAIQLDLAQVLSRTIVDPTSACSLYILTLNDLLYVPSSKAEVTSQQSSLMSIKIPNERIREFARPIEQFQVIKAPNASLYQNFTAIGKKVLAASRHNEHGDDLVLINLPDLGESCWTEKVIGLVSKKRILDR